MLEFPNTKKIKNNRLFAMIMEIENFFEGKEKALVQAIADGNVSLAKSMLAEGMTLDFHGENGITPIFWFMTNGYYDGMKRAVELGADPNFGSPDGIFPLYFLTHKNDLDIVEFFLHHGADPDTLSQKGEPALFNAIYSKNPDMMKILLRYGSDINKKDEKNQNVAFLAASLKLYDFAYYLIRNGADKNVVNVQGKSIQSMIEKHLNEMNEKRIESVFFSDNPDIENDPEYKSFMEMQRLLQPIEKDSDQYKWMMKTKQLFD